MSWEVEKEKRKRARDEGKGKEKKRGFKPPILIIAFLLEQPTGAPWGREGYPSYRSQYRHQASCSRGVS